MTIDRTRLDILVHELMLAAEKILRESSPETEYELIKRLQESKIVAVNLSDNLALFKLHFLLFHSLYRLRDILLKKQLGLLEISPLEITIKPFLHGEISMVEADPLREYYLDINHLFETSSEDVEALLGQFWKLYVAGGMREQALAILGLHEPVDQGTIKHRYKKLVMEYHPDRGGDLEKMQALNQAFAVLVP